MKPQGEYKADGEEGVGALLMVRVEWQDPCTELGWVEVTDEMLKKSSATNVSSIGYLLYQDEDKVILAGSVYVDGVRLHANEIQSYPLEAIKRLTVLKRDR